jgi:hypothetical protein
MAEITEYTYMQIRDLLESKIKYIELRDNAGTKIIRIPITDERVTHVYDRTKQEQTYSVLIKGTDADIPIPAIFAKSILLDENGNELSIEQTTSFQLNAEVDELTITHKLQVPEVD